MITISDKIFSSFTLDQVRIDRSSNNAMRDGLDSGTTFLNRFARIVAEGTSAEQQKMQSQKRDYDSRKKIEDEADERDELRGKIRQFTLRITPLKTSDFD